MAFQLDPAPEFSADVQITRPGEAEPGVLRLTFRHKGRKAFKAWLEGAKDKDDAPWLLEVVAGWDTAAHGDFTPERFAKLVDDYPASASEIWTAYGKALHESRAKN